MEVLPVNPLIEEPWTGSYEILVIERVNPFRLILGLLDYRSYGKRTQDRCIWSRKYDLHRMIINLLDPFEQLPVNRGDI